MNARKSTIALTALTASTAFIALTALTAMTLATPASAAAQRAYTGGRFALVIGNEQVGFLEEAEGGGISADVIVTPNANGGFSRKHIGQPKYEDFSLHVGPSNGKPVFDWIASSLNMNYLRKSGAITAADFNLDVRSVREFTDALLTEATFPACDASSKDPSYISLKFAPEYTRYKKASGKIKAEISTTQKSFTAADFRLDIPGLNCDGVVKIESLTVRIIPPKIPVGETREPNLEPTKIEFPNLQITISEETAQSWFQWHEDFVINGNNEEEKHKSGSLTYLSSNRKKELLTLDFHNLGIYRIVPDKKNGNGDKISTVTVGLYCESMTLKTK